MDPLRTVLILLLLAAEVLAAACVTQTISENPGSTTAAPPTQSAVPQSTGQYATTIALPGSSHPEYFRMDSDVYNAGEVVEFYVVNEGAETLQCPNLQKSYAVDKMDHGSWIRLPEPSETVSPLISYMNPGERSRTFRFLTTNWTPGKYRIAFDCGVDREFTIRNVPPVTAP